MAGLHSLVGASLLFLQLHHPHCSLLDGCGVSDNVWERVKFTHTSRSHCSTLSRLHTTERIYNFRIVHKLTHHPLLGATAI